MSESLHDKQAEQTLRQLNQEWVEALVQKDTATLRRLMDDRCVFTDALTGQDTAEFIADIEAGNLQVYAMSRDNVEIQVYEGTAIMTSLDTADWQYQGHRLQGYYRTMHVYAKQTKGCQIVAIQSSHIDSQ